MKTRTKLDLWCDRAWIKFGCMITAIMVICLLINWQNWSLEIKLLASIAALIPIHVVEEWVFPGGFHYQYNVGIYGSDKPNHYPMCRLSDMYTNLIATFLYIFLTIFALNYHVTAGMLMGTFAFCALEFVLHTVMGIKMYIRFHSQGKTTCYGPGSITAYLGFFPIGILCLYALQGKMITSFDWIICIAILLFIAVICILIPENIIKDKNTKYAFQSSGYFERFFNSKDNV